MRPEQHSARRILFINVLTGVLQKLNDEEEWRDIPGYEGYYQASSLGRIRSLDREVTQAHPSGKSVMTRLWRGRVLTVGPYSGERYRVALSREGVQEQKGVAALVSLAFHGLPPKGKPWALHRDGDMYNNVPGNLYWGDAADNTSDTLMHGHHRGVTKTHRPHGHLLDGPNLGINSTTGSRYCVSCRYANSWSRSRRLRGVGIPEAEKRAWADMKFAEIMKNYQSGES